MRTVNEVMLTIRPNPRSIMLSTQHRISSTLARKLVRKAKSQSATESFRKSLAGGPPALVTRMSGAPASAKAIFKSSVEARLQAIMPGRTPTSLSIWPAAFSHAARRRDNKVTRAPPWQAPLRMHSRALATHRRSTPCGRRIPGPSTPPALFWGRMIERSASVLLEFAWGAEQKLWFRNQIRVETATFHNIGCRRYGKGRAAWRHGAAYLTDVEMVFSCDAFDSHEEVVFVSDPACGLRAIIALHSTVLGPAIGGCRILPYADERSALRDVLRLSRGMAYKAAVADVPFGGGKTVVIADPATQKTLNLLQALGRFIDRLGGRYLTGEDVGTTAADMVEIRRSTPHVMGLPKENGGSGDPSPRTALGCFVGIEASADRVWGKKDVRGR